MRQVTNCVTCRFEARPPVTRLLPVHVPVGGDSAAAQYIGSGWRNVLDYFRTLALGYLEGREGERDIEKTGGEMKERRGRGVGGRWTAIEESGVSYNVVRRVRNSTKQHLLLRGVPV